MKDPKQPAKPDAGAKPAEEAYSEEEAERRRDAALKRALSAPPRQHKEDVGKKRKPEPQKSNGIS